MKRARSKAATSTSAPRLIPVALQTTSAAQDSSASGSFSSRVPTSALFSAKDVSILSAFFITKTQWILQLCVSAKKQKDIRDWIEARRLEGTQPTKRILILSGPSGLSLGL
jgi:hypothetical protein